MARRRTLLILVLAVVAAVAVGSAYAAGLFTPKRATATNAMAPTFALTDIYGQPFSLSSYRNSSVVLIEFTALSCSECQIVEQSLASIWPGYNTSGTPNVRIISIYIEPQFGDTIPALQAYHAKNNITWTMAQDTTSLAVSGSYHVQAIPDVFIIDKKGEVVYDQTGAQTTSTLQTTIASSLRGTAAPVGIVAVSVFALAAIAGVSTFFSPCAFPMFPGYMGLFLGLSSGSTGAVERSTTNYRGAARRAVWAGSATAFGMVLVFLVIGLVLIWAASAVSGYIPDLLLVVAVVLIALGGLLLTNLQYWRIVTPFQRLWRRLRGVPEGPEAAPIAPEGANGEGLYLKLFGYGVGYAAAAAGCVAPVIFSAIIAGLALGLVGGILTVLIYAVTAAILMIVVTVLIALANRRFINRLKAATPLIKKVSAAALIVVGVYMIYYYYTAWIH
ncbi:MAG TPA: cytochrome c biogenesis protein CcdA [Thermoplasmata archaeon]|nr:cytochrome c biogenesis protein CcdA [Thermoplasmata archaeon]